MSTDFFAFPIAIANATHKKTTYWNRHWNVNIADNSMVWLVLRLFVIAIFVMGMKRELPENRVISIRLDNQNAQSSESIEYENVESSIKNKFNSLKSKTLGWVQPNGWILVIQHENITSIRNNQEMYNKTLKLFQTSNIYIEMYPAECQRSLRLVIIYNRVGPPIPEEQIRIVGTVIIHFLCFVPFELENISNSRETDQGAL